MSKIRQILNDHTPISIGLLITIISALAWANSHFATSQDVVEIKETQKEYNRNITDIRDRLGHIEGLLEEMNHDSK